MDLDIHQDYLSLMYCHEKIAQVEPPPEEKPAEEASVVVQGDLKDLVDRDVSWQDQLRVPTRGSYLQDLLPTPTPTLTPQQEQHYFVCQLRSEGVEYIFDAFKMLELHLVAAATAVLFSAVSYMDRFLSAIHYELVWWYPGEIVLMSMACLSLAYKQQGVNLPTLSLHRRLQFFFDGGSVQLESSMIREMELQVLGALDLHLTCLTSYSFLDVLLALTHTAPTAASRCTRLLIDSLKDPSFVKYHSLVIAVSALKCVAIEDQSHDETSYFDYIRSLLRPEGPAAAAMDDTAADECFAIMKGIYKKGRLSPTSVLKASSTDDDAPSAKRRCLAEGVLISRLEFGPSLDNIG